MKNAEQQKWIDDVMDSIKDIVPAQPSPDLFMKIEAQLKGRLIPVVAWYKVSLAAAALLLLVGANIYIATQMPRQDKERAQDPVERMMQYYDLDDTNEFGI